MTGRENWVQKLLQRPDGEVVQQFKSSQSNQPIPNPDHDITGQPVVGTDPRIASNGRKTSRSQDIETRSFHEEAVKHDRTAQPVVEPGAPQTRSSDDSKSFDVEDKTAHDRTGQPVVCRDTSRARPRTCWVQFIEYTTIGLRLSGYGAAEVVINFTEELRHAETNPTCETHESYCTSH